MTGMSGLLSDCDRDRDGISFRDRPFVAVVICFDIATVTGSAIAKLFVGNLSRDGISVRLFDARFLAKATRLHDGDDPDRDLGRE